MQVDRLCTFGSLVIDVQSLSNYWSLKNRVFQLFNYFPSRLNKVQKKIKNHLNPPKLINQSPFKQFQQKPKMFLIFHWKFNPFAPLSHWASAKFDLPSNRNISKTVVVNVYRFCTCGSLVINVQSLQNLENRVFQFFRYWKG